MEYQLIVTAGSVDDVVTLDLDFRDSTLYENNNHKANTKAFGSVRLEQKFLFEHWRCPNCGKTFLEGRTHCDCCGENHVRIAYQPVRLVNDMGACRIIYDI